MNTQPQAQRSQLDWALNALFELAAQIQQSDPARIGQVDSMTLAVERRPDLCAIVGRATEGELEQAFQRRENRETGRPISRPHGHLHRAVSPRTYAMRCSDVTGPWC
jgi:hypothetical protein